MSKDMLYNRLYSDGITQVDQFNPAEYTMLIEINNYIIGFDIWNPASVKPR